MLEFLERDPVLLKMDDGASIATWDSGGSGTPIVLVHGFPENHLCWLSTLRSLDESFAAYRYILYDLRGHGRSSKIGEATWQRLFQDHLNLVEALRLPKYHLVGHDWGGATALHVAKFLPETLLSLIVLNTNYWKTDLAGMWHLMYLNIPFLPALNFRLFPNACFDLSIGKALQDAASMDATTKESYLRAFRDPRTTQYWIRLYRGMARSLLGQLSPGALKKHLVKTKVSLPPRSANAFQVPSTLIWGQEDTFNPVWVAKDMEKRLQARGAAVTLRLIENAGHFVQEDKPQVTASHLMAHLHAFEA